MSERRYAPTLDLDDDDMRIILNWFNATYDRSPHTPAEAVGAFTFNAVTFLLMVEEDREQQRRDKRQPRGFPRPSV